jgi:hypothetical protein
MGTAKISENTKLISNRKSISLLTWSVFRKPLKILMNAFMIVLSSWFHLIIIIDMDENQILKPSQ